MSDQDDISTAPTGLRSRLVSLASINEANILVPFGPQARYHQLVEEAYTVLGLVETKVDELQTELEYQHRRMDEIWNTALADKKE